MARMFNWKPSVSYRTVKDFEVDLGGCSYSDGEKSNFWITLYRFNSEEKTRLLFNKEEAKKLLESLNDFVGGSSDEKEENK